MPVVAVAAALSVVAAPQCTYESDTDYFVTPSSGHAATSTSDCCQKCYADSGCNYFTYTGDGTCWFHAQVGDKQQHAGYTSGSCGKPTPAPPPPTPPPPPVPTGLPFQNPKLPWDERAADLVSRLTLDEKGAQLGHYDVGDPSKSLGRANSPAIPRLGVHHYNYGIECNSGIVVGYPQNIGMAATFNRTLVFHAGRGTGLGLRATNFNSIPDDQPLPGAGGHPGLSCWSPMINIMRHPLWGRNHEGYGEDPFLSGELTFQVVRGMQGDDPRYALVNAGCKHFAAFDGPGNGGNAQISDGDWLRTYMVPFQRCFEAGSLSTMCTYAERNGAHGCSDPVLLTTWLRENNGFEFDGYVVSDQGAIHDPAASINAGCDVEDGWGRYQQLPSLVKSGAVNETTIDLALTRLFYVRMRHGEFDPPEMVPYKDESKYGMDAYAREFYSNVSLEAARQSITLLKNAGDLLPFQPSKFPKLAVIGIQSSVSAGYNTASGNTAHASDVLTARGFSTTFTQGCSDPGCGSYDGSAVTKAAGAADAAVVFVGRGGDEGEGHDNKDMQLPGQQRQMVLDVIATKTPAVVVLLNCNPIDIAFAVESAGVGAIVHAYYPQRWAGTAIADVLSGAYAPAGRIPYTWPRDLANAGDIGNYTMEGTKKTYRYGAPDPLFPFGYGLAYTTFSYSDLTVAPTAVKPCENVTVSVKVANTGKRGSGEVVQVYAKWEGAQWDTPELQLIGFDRVYVPAGGTATVRITISPAQMAVLNTTGFTPPAPGPAGAILPCDGNVTNGTCGTMRYHDFYPKSSGRVTVKDEGECCAACEQQSADTCKTWTFRKSNGDCYFHQDTSGYKVDTGDGGLTSGVVFSRFSPFPPCPAPTPPPATSLPVWTVVPTKLHVWVGGQQPDQKVAAASNVLTSSFTVDGPAKPLSHCAA